MARWAWLPTAQRYYDYDTHRFASADTVRDWAREAIAQGQNTAADSAALLANNQLNVGDWTMLTREQLKDEYIQQYILGRGGRDAMTQSDWGSLGNMLRDQYGYLDDFAAQVANGELTQAQIAARESMYFASATEAYERGKLKAAGAPKLPAYPGDGSSECLTNCRCEWDVVQTEDGAWEATWIIDPEAESCPTCIERAMNWNPLVLEEE